MIPYTIKCESAKRYYYEKDPVYKDNSKWLGGGCEGYWVQNGTPIGKADYLNLIEGKDRDGIKRVQSTYATKDGRTYHRAGVDFPLDDPKSVSIVEHILGGEGIQEVRENAVEKFCRYIDEHYIAYRETQNGITRVVAAPGRGIFATYSHSTSREDDPQSHTHVLIANMVQRPDGQWRALWNDNVFQHQKFLLTIYHSEMARGLSELGYTIENKGKGRYEIAGIPQEVRNLFSKRSQQIDKAEQRLKESGAFNHLKAAEINHIAALASRSSKSDKTREDLTRSWEDQLRGLGYLVDRENKCLARTENTIEKSVEPESRDSLSATGIRPSGKEIVKPGPFTDAGRVTVPVQVSSDSQRTEQSSGIDLFVNLAIRDITANESTFDSARILHESLSLSLGKFTLEEAEGALRKAAADGRVNEIAPNIFSTPEMIRIESDIIRKLKAGEARFQQIMSREEAQTFIVEHERKSGLNMTDGQKSLFLAVVSGRDQYVIAQGDAGSGKTTVFQAITEAARSKGLTIAGYSHTGKAVKEFSSLTGAPGATIASYLMSKDREPTDLKVLDEASMIGSKNMLSMIEQTDKENTRMVLIGDVKQLLPIEAGRAFGDSQIHSGLNIVEMKETVRQRTDFARSVVQAVKEKQIDTALAIMDREGKVYEEESFGKRVEIAKALFMEAPDRSVVIVSFNSERNQINNLIREDLKRSELIGTDEKTFATREQINMLESAKRYGQSYADATHVLAQKALKNMPSGVEARIVGIDSEANILTLQNATGEFHIDLVNNGDHLRAFRETERPFSVGDHIVFAKNDKQLGVQNGLAGLIKSLEDDGKITVDINGRDIMIDPEKYQYLDYGYALTDYKAQGSTYDNVIFCGMAEKTNYNSFYVASSRIKSDFRLITNNLEIFSERAVIELQKTSTLDHVLGRQQTEKTDEQMKYFHSLPESEQKKYLAEVSEKFSHLDPSKGQLQRCAAIEAYEQTMGALDQKTAQENAKSGIEIERQNAPELDVSSTKDIEMER